MPFGLLPTPERAAINRTFAATCRYVSRKCFFIPARYSQAAAESTITPYMKAEIRSKSVESKPNLETRNPNQPASDDNASESTNRLSKRYARKKNAAAENNR